jgi:hypothetical protein
MEFMRKLVVPNASRARIVVPFIVGLVLLVGVPAFAQIDFTGVWNPRTNDEDNPERLQGPSLVEFLGLPITDQARQWGLSYKSSRLSLPEHECQVHVVSYIHRGPLQVRIWEERDAVTHQLIAIHEWISTYEQHRVIWMDGRPHPGPNAPHTWMGFSTGVWEGNMLTITTTHIKQGWYRRENIPSSDEQTTIEHWVRNGNVWSHISVTEDPIFLAEPLIKSEEFMLVANPNTFNPFWNCEHVEEGEHTRGDVPSYMPGENPWIAEYAATHKLPQEVTLGGPATMYPEYRTRMKTLPVAVFNLPDYVPEGATTVPAAGAAPQGGAAAPAGGARGGAGAPAPAGGGRGGRGQRGQN